MDIVSSFTNRFNELIKDTGLSPKQISEGTGIDFTELMHWKSDKNKKLPSTRNLLKLADFFKCSFVYMLGWRRKTACQILRPSFLFSPRSFVRFSKANS